MAVIQGDGYVVRLAKAGRSTSTPAYFETRLLRFETRVRPNPVTEGGAGKWGVGHA